MFQRVHLSQGSPRSPRRLLLIGLWILALIAAASAQPPRRQAKPAKPTGANPPTATTAPPTTPTEQTPTMMTRQAAPKGWVWITQTIDLTEQLGGEENIMTLDGEPLPSMQRKRVTLGLVIDDEGHIVTRLIDVLPSKPPIDIMARAWGSKPAPAKFLGMDTVTGLCVLKSEDKSLGSAAFSTPETPPLKMNIRLYGFHPNQGQNLNSALIVGSPRLNVYPGLIAKATNDFRYTSGNPIYHLLAPQLTPVQDCSLILDRDNSVFGLAIYDAGSQGAHPVYPISRIQTIAGAVIKSHQSIAHGWLGATGIDAAPTLPTPISKPTNEDLGVRITAVAPDSPAESAGVRPKDVLLSVNDRRVQTYAQLATVIRQLPADSEITLRVKRDGEYNTLRAKLVPAPATEPEQQLVAFARRLETMEGELKATPTSDPNRQQLENKVGMMRSFVGMVTRPAPPEIRLRVFYGLEVQQLNGQLMGYFAVTNGLLITTVLENNKAARCGLMAGDVILKAGETPINNILDLLSALDKSSSEIIEMTVSRRREQVKINFLR